MSPDDRALLRALLDERLTAALATRHGEDPAVSMVPFLPRGDVGRLYLHVSDLATHTADMRRHPQVALLITAEDDGSPLSRPRVSIQADAALLDGADPSIDRLRDDWLRRYPDASMTLDLADFHFVALTPRSARLVAGFGRAGALSGEPLRQWLRGDTVHDDAS